MVFDWTNVGTPFSWCFVAALFLGAACARAVRRTSGRRRWTLVYLYLSISIAAATAGILVPGVKLFLDPRLAYFSTGVAALSFLAFRYKVAFGMPVVLIIAAGLILFSIDLREWLPVSRNGAELARVQVLAIEGGRTALEVTPAAIGPARSSVTGTLPLGSITPVAEVLIFNPSYFFIASSELCRFRGFAVSPGAAHHVELALPHAGAAGGSLLSRFPGVRYLTVVGAATAAGLLQKYDVRLSGGLELRLAAASS